ncbi:MAG: Sensor protein [Rhodospirillaceae bacterium]|nr:MAG: Sensor protein [Rhodospirillaceae bacterium]
MEPFGQGSAALSSEEGTGLGLSLTKGLVEAHGGHLIVDSAPGAGTRVTIIFPTCRLFDPVETQPVLPF